MDNQIKIKKLQLVNQVSQLEEITAFLELLGDEWGFSPGLVMSLNLVLEEAFTNVVFYAWNDDEQHLIDLDFEKNGNLLKIVLSDEGREYDPTRKEEPDLDLPVEDRSIGGLGIFLIRKIMDSVEYQRQGEKNFLIMTKNIS